MPVGVIKGPGSEAAWADAVKAAEEQYPGLKSENKDRFYAIVMTIYKNMCKNKGCTPKAESDLSMILNRIELFEDAVEGLQLPSDYEGWQLRDPMTSEDRETSRKAVLELNSNMRTAARELKAWMDRHEADESNMALVGRKLSAVWGEYIKPVLFAEEYRSIGLSDAEPAYEAGQRLINFVKNHYEIEGWTDLGDYIH